MPRFNLKTAQRAALMALGENGDSVIANLEAVGLVIVHKADLPRERSAMDTRTVEDVGLQLPDHWADPYHVTIHGLPDGPLRYGVEFGAIHSVREAHQLQRTLGYRVTVSLDDQAELVTAVTACPPHKARPVTRTEGGEADVQTLPEAAHPNPSSAGQRQRRRQGAGRQA